MKKFILVLIIMLFSGCSDTLYDLLSRPNVPPFEERPSVQSFNSPLQLQVNWRADVGADEYILYRDTSATGDFTTKVYQGATLGYTDYYVEDAKWYYYRLCKRRGKQFFATAYYGFGVGNNSIADEYENNNTKDCATQFISTKGIDASIYYYKDGVGNIIQDSDWYRVVVAAQMQMTIAFESYVNIDSNGGILYKEEFGQPDPLNSGEEKTLENTGLTDKVFYFQILPAASSFFNDEAAGGKIGNYRIRFVGTHPAGQ